MTARTYLLVACSSGKRVPPEPRLRLGHTYDTPHHVQLKEHVASWVSRLGEVESEPHPAANLYKGEQWAEVRTLAQERPDVSVWVCSAGYGLVGYQARLKSYSATFASGEPDSVHRIIDRSSDADRITDWWSELSNWAGPTADEPRRISQLVQTESRSRFVVALSQPYIDACSLDLEEAAASTDRDRLIIVAANELPNSISRLRVPAPGALRNRLGGTVGTVVVRLATLLIREGKTSGDQARQRALRLTREAGALPRYERRRDPSGVEIKAFIQRHINEGAGASASALLRRYRDAGGACEQLRFRGVYREVVEGANHG